MIKYFEVNNFTKNETDCSGPIHLRYNMSMAHGTVLSLDIITSALITANFFLCDRERYDHY